MRFLQQLELGKSVKSLKTSVTLFGSPLNRPWGPLDVVVNFPIMSTFFCIGNDWVRSFIGEGKYETARQFQTQQFGTANLRPLFRIMDRLKDDTLAECSEQSNLSRPEHSILEFEPDRSRNPCIGRSGHANRCCVWNLNAPGTEADNLKRICGQSLLCSLLIQQTTIQKFLVLMPQKSNPILKEVNGHRHAKQKRL